LRGWVILPNHVHALFKVRSVPVARILASWKKFSARGSNIILGRRGDFWHEDYWDTFIRDQDHELKTRRYIENNPTKALLARDARGWPWSSARLRDDYGRLCC